VKKSKETKEPKAKKAPAIQLNDIMAAVDFKSRNFYADLTDEQRKAFSAWMMMRYASSVQGRDAAHYLIMVNELINKNFSDVSGHPELQWLLLSACGSGRKQYHPYIKPPNARKKRDKVSEFLGTVYPMYKHDELALLVELNDVDALRQLARDHGHDDKAIEEIFGKQ